MAPMAGNKLITVCRMAQLCCSRFGKFVLGGRESWMFGPMGPKSATLCPMPFLFRTRRNPSREGRRN